MNETSNAIISGGGALRIRMREPDQRTAVLSPDGRYRYVLRRAWVLGEPTRNAVFVMLNPSTADEMKDDATIRKCVGFAKRWNCDGIVVVNLFAWRARDPREMFGRRDYAVGFGNDQAITDAVGALNTDRVIVAWGKNGERVPTRVREVCSFIRRVPLLCLGRCKSGHPLHPLMVAYSTPLSTWRPEEIGQ